MKKILNLKVLVFALFISSVVFIQGSWNKADAASSCEAPYYIPSGCGNDANGNPNIEPDYECMNVKILKPGSSLAQSCCINKCKGGTGTTPGQETASLRRLEAFGAQFAISASSIPKIINIVFSTVLGLISIYVLIRGIYVAGVKRTQATSADQIATLNKELTNLVIGFIILWSIIFIIQVVFGLLGLGSVSDIKIGTDPSDKNVIVIQ